jgi:hypothetical protein
MITKRFNMNKNDMMKAFKSLDKRLKTSTRIIVGGGAALVVAYGVPISTQDVDGVPDRSSMELADFKKEVRAVGRELGVSQDWLNDHFSTFLFVLPSDYGSRLVSLYRGKNLEVCALGKEDLVIMKCFAGREKDIPHVRVLLKKGADLKVVDDRLHELMLKNVSGAQKASDFLSDICEEMGVST